MVLKTRRWLGVRGQDKNSGADAKNEDGAGVYVVQRDEHHLEYHDRVSWLSTLSMMSDCAHGISWHSTIHKP